jgi:hypothetical protein
VVSEWIAWALVGGGRHCEANHNYDNRGQYRDTHIRHGFPWRRSAAENNPAEAVQGEAEIDAPDNGRGQNLWPQR